MSDQRDVTPIPKAPQRPKTPRRSLRSKRLDPAEQARRERVRERVFRRDGGCLLAGHPDAGRCFGDMTFQHRRTASALGGYTEVNGATLCAWHNTAIESDARLVRLAQDLGLTIREGHPEWDDCHRRHEAE